MSLCGNCPIPYEDCLPEDEDCPYECSYQDAVYKTQQAYWDLLSRYEELEKKYEELKNETKCNSIL